MGLTLERLLFDPADAAEGPKIGSYIVGASGDVATTSTVGGKKALDVSIADGVNVEVDLSHVDDSVKIGDGTDFLAVNADGSINAVVSATDLDIRDLQFATDSVDVSGSEVSLDAATLAALENITVSATDLDIRDLAFATDSVTAHQGGSWTVTAAAPNTTVLATAVSVTTSATLLPASALANRKKIEIQNNGDKSIFVGGSGVTTASGVEVAKGATYSQELGPSALIYAIVASGTCDVRVMEIS